MSRGSTPRHAQTAGDLGFDLAFRAAPLFSGRIVPRVTIGGVTLFILRERPNGNTRYMYCRLFTATTAYTSACIDAGAALAPM